MGRKAGLWPLEYASAMQGAMTLEPGSTGTFARISQVHRISPRVLHLTLDVSAAPGGSFSWRPGQHLRLIDPAGKEEDSYYSIASAQSATRQSELDLAVLEDSFLYEPEVGTRLLVGAPGGAAPFERFVQASTVVLIGIGTGVAPLRALVQGLLAESEKSPASKKIVLIQGCRSRLDCLYFDEFSQLSGAGFEYRPVFSRHDGTVAEALRQGRVQAHLEDLPREGTEYCLCGSIDMVRDVTQVLLSLGVEQTHIFGEGY